MLGRSRAAVVYALSVAVLTGVVVSAAAFGVGVRTSYGNGITGALGAKVEQDFLSDQAAEAAALSASDASPLEGHFGDSALVDVGQQISAQSAGGPPPSVSFQPSSLTILEAQDRKDPSLVIKVQEDGTRNVTTAGGPNATPNQQSISFHGDFWLRADSSGHYLIADQSIENQPPSPTGSILLLVTALVWVCLAAILVRRQRQRIPLPADAISPDRGAAVVDAPTAEEAVDLPAVPQARVVIRTFGGLQLHQGGEDWATALSGRPVTTFVVLRLLIQAIRPGNTRVSRKELGEQVSPGVDRETQLKTMRNLVYGLRELPAALRERIVAEPRLMSFSLEDCEVDAVELLAACRACAGRRRLSPALLARARRAVDASGGVFLPEFEGVEDLATGHHPTCTQLIAEVREWLTGRRQDLILALADTYLVGNRATDAVALLEPAQQADPARIELRSSLVEAYRQVGRNHDAAALELGVGRQPSAV